MNQVEKKALNIDFSHDFPYRILDKHQPATPGWFQLKWKPQNTTNIMHYCNRNLCRRRRGPAGQGDAVGCIPFKRKNFVSRKLLNYNS